VSQLRAAVKKLQSAMGPLKSFFAKLEPITGLLTKKFKMPNPGKWSCPTNKWKNIDGICYKCPDGYKYNKGLLQCQEVSIPKCPGGYKETHKSGVCRTCTKTSGPQVRTAKKKYKKVLGVKVPKGCEACDAGWKALGLATGCQCVKFPVELKCKGLRKAGRAALKFGTVDTSVEQIVNKFVKGLKKLEKIPGYKELMKLFEAALKPIDSVLAKALKPLKPLVKKATLPGIDAKLLTKFDTSFGQLGTLKVEVDKLRALVSDKASQAAEKIMELLPESPCTGRFLPAEILAQASV